MKKDTGSIPVERIFTFSKRGIIMYSLNSIATGEAFSFQSFDDAIDFIEEAFPEEYKVIKDRELNKVWWVVIDDLYIYMLTSLERANNIYLEEEK